jgi:hypothetical protein
MHALAAASITVSGIDGVLEIIAVICFLVALVAAVIASPRNYWAVGIAGGLLAWVLTLLVK